MKKLKRLEDEAKTKKIQVRLEGEDGEDGEAEIIEGLKLFD